MTEKREKAAIVCCSNGLEERERENIERLTAILKDLGLEPVISAYLYAKHSVFCGTARERAGALMQFFRDPEVTLIFDVSGGDVANELLPYLNYEEIAASRALFCGYSDLTTIMNGIYARTGKASVWYQAKHLAGRDGERQRRMFAEAELFDIRWEWIQGEAMRGIVVGGNIRCLLKLAGTPYWPKMRGKILFLEARSGSLPQMTAYVNQLKQMGVFEEVNGILLGTFLQMEKEGESMAELVKQCAGERLPIAGTGEVGHRADSKALWIGRETVLV